MFLLATAVLVEGIVEVDVVVGGEGRIDGHPKQAASPIRAGLVGEVQRRVGQQRPVIVDPAAWPPWEATSMRPSGVKAMAVGSSTLVTNESVKPGGNVEIAEAGLGCEKTSDRKAASRPATSASRTYRPAPDVTNTLLARISSAVVSSLPCIGDPCFRFPALLRTRTQNGLFHTNYFPQQGVGTKASPH